MEEPITEQTDTDDTVSSDEILSSLRKEAKKVEEMFIDCEQRVRNIRKKVKEEIMSFSKMKLVPKERTKLWLTKHKLPAKITFHKFFEALLHEHHKEHRCNISDRTILLNKDAAELLGYEKEDTSVHVLDIIAKLPSLFE